MNFKLIPVLTKDLYCSHLFFCADIYNFLGKAEDSTLLAWTRIIRVPSFRNWWYSFRFLGIFINVGHIKSGMMFSNHNAYTFFIFLPQMRRHLLCSIICFQYWTFYGSLIPCCYSTLKTWRLEDPSFITGSSTKGTSLNHLRIGYISFKWWLLCIVKLVK